MYFVYFMFQFGILFSLMAVYFEKRRKVKLPSCNLKWTLSFGRVCIGLNVK